jgi:hypothetical protein
VALGALVLVLAGCGSGSGEQRGEKIVVADLGESITAGSPGYEPDPKLRRLLGSGSDERRIERLNALIHALGRDEGVPGLPFHATLPLRFQARPASRGCPRASRERSALSRGRQRSTRGCANRSDKRLQRRGRSKLATASPFRGIRRRTFAATIVRDPSLRRVLSRNRGIPRSRDAVPH